MHDSQPTFDWQLDRCGDPVMIATHRRSGTHLLIDFLRRQFPSFQSWKFPGEPADRLYLAMGSLARGMTHKSTARRILRRAARPILKTHSLPDFDLQRGGFEALVDWARTRGQLIYCIRDCRAVMASMYLYMQSYEPRARVPAAEFLRQTDPQPEFMRPEHSALSRPAQWARHVEDWRTQAGVLVVRYEDVLRQPRETLEALSAHLGEKPIWREPLLPPKSEWSLASRIRQRLLVRPIHTAIVSPPLRGADGQRRDVLGPEEKAYIWSQAGETMRTCGYAESGP